MLAEQSFAVRYAEVDAQQVAYYANHPAWFELGTEALLAGLGHPLGLERPPVLEATCRYRAAIRYGETVTVESRLLGAQQDDLWLGHRIKVGEEVRAEGTTLLGGVGKLAGPAMEPLESWPRFDDQGLEPHGRVEAFPLCVRYAETEPTGHAHYARYFVWMEVARIAFLHRLGIHYAQMETHGSPFVIAQAGCRYFSPVDFDDEVRIEAWLCKVSQRSFCLAYRLAHAGDGRPVALGRSAQAFIGPDRRSAPIPQTIRQLLLAAGEGSTTAS